MFRSEYQVLESDLYLFTLPDVKNLLNKQYMDSVYHSPFGLLQNKVGLYPVDHDLFLWWFSSRRIFGLGQTSQDRVTPQSPLTWSSWSTLTPKFNFSFRSRNFFQSAARIQTLACPRYVSNSTYVCIKTALGLYRAPLTPPDTTEVKSLSLISRPPQ